MNFLGKLFISGHVWLYRATGGKLGSSMGGPVLLLTTTGAKSGRPRTVPVMYFSDGDHRVVVASAGGSPAHPAWYKNLAQNPQVTVELPGESYPARAEVVTGEDRARLWRSITGTQPRFAAYASKTDGREIPIVVLKK